MTKILFCGTSVPDQVEYQTKNISAAGNRFQNNMIQAIASMLDDVTTLSYLAFPIDASMQTELEKVKHYQYTIRGSRKLVPFLKSLITFNRKMKENLEGKDLVICYNVCYAWLTLPALARKRHVKSAIVLADYSDTDSYKSIFSKLYAKIQKNSFRKFDTVIGLSEHIADHLKKDQTFLLMEGAVQQEFYDRFKEPVSRTGGFSDNNSDKKAQEKIRILYSGLLSKVTGVDLLIEAMAVMDPVFTGPAFAEADKKKPEMELILTGKGDLEDYVKECEKKHSWMHCMGHRSYEEYIQILQSADILVNPRNMKLPENKNNFPSKIMDYLAAGKYVVSTRFSGYERFQPYVVFTEESRLAEALREAVHVITEESREEAKQRYLRNRTFAAEFLWDRQMERILQSIDKT